MIMGDLSIRDWSITGMQIGLGVAIIPVAVTTLIACSKAIVINILFGIAIQILTGGMFTGNLHYPLIEVPLLWKISYVSALLGVGIIALSATVYVIDALYQRYAYGTPLYE